jgi:simple sugar transport system ATP-binding protein
LTAFSQVAEEGKRTVGAAKGSGKNLLKAKAVGLKGSVAPFDLDLNEGDVLGLAGLLGSGRTEMARLLFGIDSGAQGEIFINGKKANITSPSHAVKAGMAFCSEDRKTEGILADLTVRENIILALQGSKGMLRYIPLKKQTEIAEKLIKSLGIKTPSPNAEAKQLSGGNQQKMLLARWLVTEPKLLILDEPTRGIDVGAKLEIMELILDLSRKGMGLIFISSEFEEVIRCSNRIAVLKDKAMVAELSGESINESSIMRTIAGGK